MASYIKRQFFLHLKDINRLYIKMSPESLSLSGKTKCWKHFQFSVETMQSTRHASFLVSTLFQSKAYCSFSRFVPPLDYICFYSLVGHCLKTKSKVCLLEYSPNWRSYVYCMCWFLDFFMLSKSDEIKQSGKSSIYREVFIKHPSLFTGKTFSTQRKPSRLKN